LELLREKNQTKMPNLVMKIQQKEDVIDEDARKRIRSELENMHPDFFLVL
jgi:hypothetical protein